MITEKLSGKRAIITGGSRGIGFSTAKALASHGVNLLISGKNPESIARAAKAVADEYRNITVVPFAADLSIKETPQAIIYETINKLGGIDFLINNAGISLSKPLENTEEDEWDAVMTVNAKAPYFLCKYALPHLRK
jgi:3-oxoacyl-[acyl-carrier protein] reductase